MSLGIINIYLVWTCLSTEALTILQPLESQKNNTRVRKDRNEIKLVLEINKKNQKTKPTKTSWEL